MYIATDDFKVVLQDKITRDQSQLKANTVASYLPDAVLSIDFDAGCYTFLELTDGCNHEIIKVVGKWKHGILVNRGQCGTEKREFNAGYCLQPARSNVVIKHLMDDLETKLLDRLEGMVEEAIDEKFEQIACGQYKVKLKSECVSG